MLSGDAPAVRGVISPPALHRGTRDHVVIFVNGRRIQHRNLAFAVEQAYRGLREPDRFPLVVLNVLVDPADVDVNVHPTKREVRFKNEGAVFAALERACYHVLRQSPLYQLQATASGPLLELRETAVVSTAQTAPTLPSPASGGGEVVDDDAGSLLPPLEYVGQLLHGYLVAEAPSAVVLVDQHAAHERVLFDRILHRLEGGEPSSQLLLLPHDVDLMPAQVTAFQQHAAWLEALGFTGELFGPHTIRLRAAPSDMPEGRVARVLDLLLTDLAGERTPDRRSRETAALLARHSAGRSGGAATP